MSRVITFSSLPDQLVVHVFSSICLAERQRTLVLVCKGWQRLVHSPELLQELTISISCHGVVARCGPLCQWLAERTAGHVQRLELVLSDYSEVPDDDARDLLAALTASLAACDATGSLHELWLTLEIANRLSMSSWLLLSLRHVRRLHLSSYAHVCIQTPLGVLTALEELELSEGLHLSTTSILPQSLAKLSMGRGLDTAYAVLPQQLPSIPNLRCLHLYGAEGGYGPLSQLRQLTELKLGYCIPADELVLAPLTSLGRLLIQQADRNDFDMLESCLPHLQQLTHLTVHCQEGCGTLMAGLSHLSQLHCLCWDSGLEEACVLPPGQWLASLQQLALPTDSVASSLATLKAAKQLTCLCIYSRGRHLQHPGLHPGSAVLRWAAQHSTLQKVRLARYGNELPAALFDAAVDAKACKPSLCIERVDPAVGQPEGLLDGA